MSCNSSRQPLRWCCRLHKQVAARWGSQSMLDIHFRRVRRLQSSWMPDFAGGWELQSVVPSAPFPCLPRRRSEASGTCPQANPDQRRQACRGRGCLAWCYRGRNDGVRRNLEEQLRNRHRGESMVALSTLIPAFILVISSLALRTSHGMRMRSKTHPTTFKPKAKEWKMAYRVRPR